IQRSAFDIGCWALDRLLAKAFGVRCFLVWNFFVSRAGRRAHRQEGWGAHAPRVPCSAPSPNTSSKSPPFAIERRRAAGEGASASTRGRVRSPRSALKKQTGQTTDWTGSRGSFRDCVFVEIHCFPFNERARDLTNPRALPRITRIDANLLSICLHHSRDSRHSRALFPAWSACVRCSRGR